MKPRRPIIAFVLNMFAPGLGHLYVGRAARWGVSIAFVLATYFAFGLAGALSSFWGYSLAMTMFVGVYIFLLVDAPMQAARTPTINRKWYHRWYVYLTLILGLFLYSGSLPNLRPTILGFNTFRVPGDLMAPTILQGDYILVDTKAYRDNEPMPGDVVVVAKPDTGLNQIRRVAANSSASDLRLVSDNRAYDDAMGPQWNTANRENFRGRVTCVYFSWDFSRVGRKIK